MLIQFKIKDQAIDDTASLPDTALKLITGRCLEIQEG